MADMDVDPPQKMTQKEGKEKDEGKQRFEVKKVWDTLLCEDNCAICRNHIMDLCA
ncbi:hypothetical protein C0991_011904 [Blastosporella zonata]|nr:hypothetical protein C0991_011904 [Blastosporella zonata]